MPFFIPSKIDILKRTRAAFSAEMPGSDAYVWPSNVYVSAKVIAGAAWEVLGRLLFLDKQRFAQTAEKSFLDKHAAEWGLGRNPPTFAGGNITVPVVYPYTVPLGTVFTRADGIKYISNAAVSLLKFSPSLILTVPVTAQTIGKVGNLAAGAPMTTSLAGLTGGCVVDNNGLGGGADVETDNQLRLRVLARKRQPPQGGAAYDYVSWAKLVPGVTRVFVGKQAFGPGTVGIWFLMDDTYPYGIPQLSDVANVQNVINGLCPATAIPIVAQVIAKPVDIIIQGLTPDTPTSRQAVGAEVYSMFRNMTQPSVGAAPFTLRVSWIWQAIANATGNQYFTLISPAADTTYPVGVLPILNSIRFR